MKLLILIEFDPTRNLVPGPVRSLEKYLHDEIVSNLDYNGFDYERIDVEGVDGVTRASILSDVDRDHDFKVGDRVFWMDPDNGITSGYGTVIALQDSVAESLISLRMDDGGEVTTLAHELKREETK